MPPRDSTACLGVHHQLGLPGYGTSQCLRWCRTPDSPTARHVAFILTTVKILNVNGTFDHLASPLGPVMPPAANWSSADCPSPFSDGCANPDRPGATTYMAITELGDSRRRHANEPISVATGKAPLVAKRLSCPADLPPTSSACSTHSFSRIPPTCFQSFRELVSTALTDKWMPPSRPRSTSHQAEEVLRLLERLDCHVPGSRLGQTAAPLGPVSGIQRQPWELPQAGGQGETRRENSRTPQLRATVRAPLRSSSPPRGPHRIRTIGVHADDWGEIDQARAAGGQAVRPIPCASSSAETGNRRPRPWYWHQGQRTVMAGAESV